MAEKIIINPLTRISGFMEIDVTVENNKIVEAKTKGFLFRGFEQMLVGRNPFDAVYFTERICGICSTAHAMSATLALENALNIRPSEQGRYLKDIVHGCEFIQNHLRHFYQFTIPDFVRMPAIHPLYSTGHNDFRLPAGINEKIARNYFTSLEMSSTAHEMLAVLGGKVPHNHGVFIGGITTQPTVDKIIKIKSILKSISRFIKDKMIPDVYSLSEYYPDYFNLGRGYGNLLSYGCFNNYKDLGTLYVNPLIYLNGKTIVLNPDKITEKIKYSWYDSGRSSYQPFERVPEPDMDKDKAYSWVKAPRYENLPFEVGPLARQWLSGEYKKGISAMDRLIARVLETRKIAEIMEILLDNVTPNISVQEVYTLPDMARGRGLVDTTRGALGHWIKIENGEISFYQIITPTAWNLSTRDENGLRGVAEQALIGTPVQNPEAPVEIGRIIRSFDPCISCATHVYRAGHKIKTIRVL